jgi:hypothetical protein
MLNVLFLISTFCGFGHLVGPIIGRYALLEGDFAISFIDIFPTYSIIEVIFFCKTRPKKAILRTKRHELAHGNMKTSVL